jgi:hypothetical protein
MCRSAANQTHFVQTVVCNFIDRANDFLDAGFIRPALSDQRIAKVSKIISCSWRKTQDIACIQYVVYFKLRRKPA